MSEHLGIPRGFVRERAVAHGMAALERLSEEHPDADGDRVGAVGQALVTAFYAGATAIAGEIHAQLAELSASGRLLYREEDGHLVPFVSHLHVD